MQSTHQHGGYAKSTRTGGALENRIADAMRALNGVPLDLRNEDWAVVFGGVKHAQDLLADGRRAKAGKVFAAALQVAEELS